MQIEQLRLFHLAATMKNISRAAELSHISQPALSQQIQRLEYEINMRLLERSNKGVELTQAGEIVARYAGHFSTLYENMLQDLENLRLSTRVIRISSSPVVGIYSLPCTLFKAKEMFTSYDFQLSTMPSTQVERLISQGESDIGFMIGKPRDESLFHKKVYSDNVILLSGYQYDAPERLDMESLKDYPLLMLYKQSSFRTQVERYLEGIGRHIDEFNILFTLDSAESVKSLVLDSRGLAFLPYVSVKKELYLNQVKQIKLEGFDMDYDVYMICKKTEDEDNTIPHISRYFARIAPHTFC